MKMKKLPLILFISLLTGCSINNINNNDPVNPNPDPQGGDPLPEENHLQDIIDESFLDSDNLYEQFFTYGNKISIELDFTNEAIINLEKYGEYGENNSNFVKNEMYHPCTAKITINDKTSTYYEVGVRVKGNFSRKDIDIIDENGHFIEDGYCHFKLSFSETFDDKKDNDYYINSWTNEDSRANRDDRKFAKMKKIDLKWNRNYDNTFTKELYLLDSFNKEGVMAQKANLVSLTINSESDSRTTIYQALEAIDKQFIKKRNKKDSDGDLYKCAYFNSKADLTDYSSRQVGIEGVNYRPSYDLKTNDKNDPEKGKVASDMSVMKNFIDQVKKKSISGEEYYNNIINYLDYDNFLKYSALCWVFGLPDDLRNNANNYYIYFNKENKAVIFPYDNDRCLGIRNGWNKDLKNVAYDDPYAKGYDSFNSCPLVLRLLSGGSNNSHPVHQDSKDAYKALCIEYANKYLDNTKFDEFTKLFEGIAPSIDISNAGIDNDTFLTYSNSKKSTLDN